MDQTDSQMTDGSPACPNSEIVYPQYWEKDGHNAIATWQPWKYADISETDCHSYNYTSMIDSVPRSMHWPSQEGWDGYGGFTASDDSMSSSYDSGGHTRHLPDALTSHLPATLTSLERQSYYDTSYMAHPAYNQYQNMYTTASQHGNYAVSSNHQPRPSGFQFDMDDMFDSIQSLSDQDSTDDSISSLQTCSSEREFTNKRISTETKGCYLWEFVRDLLKNDKYNPSHIEWVDREEGIFRFVKSDRVAKLWGRRKNNPAMSYEKMSRAMRYYYRRNILEKTEGQKLVYKFGRAATGWRIDE